LRKELEDEERMSTADYRNVVEYIDNEEEEKKCQD